MCYKADMSGDKWFDIDSMCLIQFIWSVLVHFKETEYSSWKLEPVSDIFCFMNWHILSLW